MTKIKQETLINEISLYLEYDKILSNEEKKDFLKNLKFQKINNEWEQIIFDYFDSHIDEEGNILSLELCSKKIKKYNSSYYSSVNDRFIKELFNNVKPLYFFDVDNTLTEYNHVSEEKRTFLNNFKGKSRVILSTGKAFFSIENVSKICGLTNNYASSLNGSVLVYQGKQETISKIGDVSKEIAKKLKEQNINYILYYKDRIVVDNPLNEDNIYYMNKYDEEVDYSVTNINYSEIIKILAFIYEGENEKEQIVRDIIKNEQDLICVRTGYHCYEVLRKDQHKGNTVKIISKLLNHYYRASIGVGDSMNDLQMLNYVGVPYVVNTASSELKECGFIELEEDRKIDIVNLIKKYEGDNYE